MPAQLHSWVDQWLLQVIFVSLQLLLPVVPVDASQVYEQVACQQHWLRVKMTTTSWQCSFQPRPTFPTWCRESFRFTITKLSAVSNPSNQLYFFIWTLPSMAYFFIWTLLIMCTSSSETLQHGGTLLSQLRRKLGIQKIFYPVSTISSAEVNQQDGLVLQAHITTFVVIIIFISINNNNAFRFMMSQVRAGQPCAGHT